MNPILTCILVLLFDLTTFLIFTLIMPKKRSSASAPIPPKMLIRLANERPNPLKLLEDFDPQSSCLRRKVDDSLSIRITCSKWNELDESTQQWALELTERNMKELYEASAWGWNRSSKASELKHADARHLLVFQDGDGSSSDPIAFVHFRFEEGYSSDATLYCYELQLVEQFRRRGIGRLLMNLLLELATAHRMRKVLLTVLKKNTEAFQFYTEGLKFCIDKNSPSKFGQVADYEILSKRAPDQVKKAES